MAAIPCGLTDGGHCRYGQPSAGEHTDSEEDAIVPLTRLGRYDYVTSVVSPMVDHWVMVGTDRLKRMMPVVQKALHDITQAFATGSTVGLITDFTYECK